MILSIDIKNFQSHRNTHVDLSPGVNVVIGVSDSGKTALLRAMDWLINNRPTGDEFRSKWGGDTSVTFNLDDGNRIERIRTKALNCYRIGELTLEAMKTEVPAEVKTLLNMHDINIQRQHDKPFLFSENSGDVAKYLNEVANLEKIDRSLSSVSAMERNKTMELKREEQECDTLQTSLKDYDYLVEAEAGVQALEVLEKDVSEARDRKIRITEILAKISEVSATHKKIQTLLQIVPEVDKLSSLVAFKATLIARKDRLIKLGSQINGCRKTITGFPDYLDNGAVDVESVRAMLKECRDINGRELKLSTLVRTMEITGQEASRGVNAIAHWEDMFKKKMPSVCPLCNTNLKGN